MSKLKTHILRVMPPWREDGNRSRCGRRAETRMPVIEPDAAVAAEARPYWQWSEVMRDGHALHAVPQHIRETYPGGPEGTCVPCWLNLGHYGYQDWRADPLAVLRVDLAITNEHGREALAKELVGLADLVAAQREEFRDLLEREGILTAFSW